MAPRLAPAAKLTAGIALALLACLLLGDVAVAHHIGGEPDQVPASEAGGDGGSGNGAVTAIVLVMLVVTGVALAALKHVAGRGAGGSDD